MAQAGVPLWHDQGAVRHGMAVRQRQRLHRQGHRRHRMSHRPDAALHARPQSGVEHHVRSFLKTLKRDYVRVTILPDADTTLALLPLWIGDYCEVHPDSGLKFRSPRVNGHRSFLACGFQNSLPGRVLVSGISVVIGLDPPWRAAAAFGRRRRRDEGFRANMLGNEIGMLAQAVA